MDLIASLLRFSQQLLGPFTGKICNERYNFTKRTVRIGHIYVTMFNNTYSVEPLVKIGCQTEKDTGVKICLVNSWTYGTDSDWYHWTPSKRYGFQIYHRYHLYVYTLRGAFPKEVTAIAAADALWRHTCRFTALLEIVTDFSSQPVYEPITNEF